MKSSAVKKITISGWYGHFNAGDDAILQVFIEEVGKRLGCKIVVLSENPQNIERTMQVEGMYHLFPTYSGTVTSWINGDFFKHLRNLRESEWFVLGGGGILRDDTNWRNLIRILDEIWLSKLLRRKVMLYSIGVGPLKSRLGKFLIGQSVKLCDLITVRDTRSAKLLEGLGVCPEKIHVVADPAFLLEPSIPHDLDLVAMLSGTRKVGVFPTFGRIHGEQGNHAHRLAEAFDRIFEQTGIEFIAMPMQVKDAERDDRKVSHQIRDAMRHPEALQIYERRLTPSELRWVTKKTLFNITVRLHAMIFSLAGGKPTIAINYEPKVANVFNVLESPEYLIQINEKFEENLIFAAKHCMENLSEYSDQISTKIDSHKKLAVRTFELLQSASMLKQDRDKKLS